MKSIVLVLDKYDYKENEKSYISILQEKFDDVRVVYTEYEDAFIRKVRNFKKIGSVLQHIAYWLKSFDYAKKIIKAQTENIICINPIVGIFLGLFNKKRKKNIVICGFLFEKKDNPLYYKARITFVKKALDGIQTAVVYSEQEVDYYENLLGIKNKFKFVKYGIDYSSERRYSGSLPKEYFFSGGGSNRDYMTLLSAYHSIPENIRPQLCIATNPKCLSGLDISGVIVLTDVVLETFGSVMKQSKALILSLRDSEISAGHQVMLEALKNNVPVIVNKIRAVEDYVTSDDVTFYRSGDCRELAGLIKDFKQRNISTEKLYRKEYTFECLLRRLVSLL